MTIRAVGSHVLHAPDRVWPETNCYVDLWIELLHAMGRDPLPLLGLAAALDWEEDHFTFVKPCAADIFAVTGVTLHEFALWDRTATQVIRQVRAGAVPLLEVDAFFLPDTRSNAYRHSHTKTTIAVIGIEPEAGRLEYFHNAGRFSLEGDDYAGVLGLGEHGAALFPFAELARVAAAPVSPAEAMAMARVLLQRFAASRRSGNPVRRFAAALPDLLAAVGPDPERINALCFNTTRQFGGAFGLFADHLSWLGQDGTAAAWLAEAAKPLQFRIARAARRQRFDPDISATLEEVALVWQRCMNAATVCVGERQAA